MPSRVAQGADCLRQGELLARHAGDEAPAADLATRLQPPIAAQQVAPGRQPLGLAGDEAPEHHAIALQQRACDEFHGLHIVRRRRHCRRSWFAPQQCPAARVLDAKKCRAPPPLLPIQRAAAIRGHQQRTQPAEAVGVDQALGDQFGQGLLHLRAQQAGSLDHLVEEGRAVFGEIFGQ